MGYGVNALLHLAVTTSLVLLPSATFAQLTTEIDRSAAGLEGTVLDLVDGTPISQAKVTLTAGFVGNNPM